MHKQFVAAQLIMCNFLFFYCNNFKYFQFQTALNMYNLSFKHSNIQLKANFLLSLISFEMNLKYSKY